VLSSWTKDTMLEVVVPVFLGWWFLKQVAWNQGFSRLELTSFGLEGPTIPDVIHLKEDNTLITDKLEVAEVFNKYYSSVLRDSDSSINRHTVVDYLSSNHQSISAIRTHCPVAQPFQFRHVTPPELEIILKSLDPKQATGHDLSAVCIIQQDHRLW